MKKLFLTLVGGFLMAASLMAGVRDYVVSPSALGDWQVTGAAREKLQVGDTLKLPAGTEISRTFGGGAILLYTVSNPNFGSVSNDWPVVQVGPAALTLIRQGNQGTLALLVGEAVSTVPLVVMLDASGRTIQPLEFALGYDPLTKIGVVAFGDQTLSFKGTTNGPGTEVAVAAGEKHAWSQDSLEVLVIGPDEQPEAAKTGDNAAASKRAALLKAAAEKLRDAVGVMGGEIGHSAAPTTAAPDIKAGPGLEVFTPPAVRHHAVAIRQTIAKDLKK